MAGEPGGISGSIRRQLAEGRSREDIVAGLMAGGLSKPSAERFVDREVANQLPPLPPLVPVMQDAPAQAPALPPPPIPEPEAGVTAEAAEAPAEAEAEPEPVHAPGQMYEGPLHEGPPPGASRDALDRFFTKDDAERAAYNDLRFGSYFTAGGIGLTLISMLYPGRGVLFYGAILYGLYRFGRGVVRSAQLDRFPWGRVIGYAAIPIVSFPVFMFGVAAYSVQRGLDEQEEWIAGLGAERDVENEIVRKAGDAAERRQNRNNERVDALIDALWNGYQAQCETAASLATSNSTLAAEALINYLRGGEPSQSTQVCAVRALVRLGEIDHAMSYYRQWIYINDADLWRSAVLGMGEIGPDAATVAIPLLKNLVYSDAWTERYLVVHTLGRLGPDAEELLTVLTEDENEHVSAEAKRALKRLQ